MRLLTAVVAALLLCPAVRASETVPPSANPAAPEPANPAQPASPDAAGPADLRKLLARELPALPPMAFQTPRGIRGEVEAKTPPSVKDGDGGEIVSIPIGTAQPVTCTIFPTRIDAGGSTWRLADRLARSVDVVQALPTDVVEVAGSAILFSQFVYRTKSDKGPLAGILELAVQPHQSHSLICMHDEPGYSATFRRIVTGLAGSLRGQGEDARPEGRFAEIQVVRIGSLAVGFSERVIWDRQDGGRTTLTWAAQLLPRSPREFVAIDSVEREESDEHGLLIEATHVRADNGVVDSNFTVTRSDDGKTFRYSGEKAGKKLQGTFESAAGLATEIWFARQFDAKSGFGPKDEVRHEGWSSATNPIAVTPIVYKRDPAGPRTAHMTFGPLSMSGELDEHGLFARSEMPIGPATLVVARLWTRGAP